MKRLEYFVNVLRRLKMDSRPPLGRLMVLGAIAELAGGDGRGYVDTVSVARRVGSHVDNAHSVLTKCLAIEAIERVTRKDQPDLVRLTDTGAAELQDYLDPRI